MIPQLPLGTNGPAIGRLGYGAMVLEGYYGPSNDEQAVETIRHAFATGATLPQCPQMSSPHELSSTQAPRSPREFLPASASAPPGITT